MPISAPGSSGRVRTAAGPGRAARGFTLLELLVVLVIVAMISSVVVLSMRDGLTTQLEREGERLGADGQPGGEGNDADVGSWQ